LRAGRVFRRCGKCRKAIAKGERACACGSKSSSWTFVVDANPVGAPRHQLSKGGFTTADEARAALTKLQSEKADGRYVEPSKLTVGAFLADWQAGKGRLRASTRTSYAGAVRRLTPIIGSVNLQELTMAMVSAAYTKIAETPTSLGKPPAVKTVHLVHLALHAALNDALKQGKVTRNVADGAHQPPRDGETPEMKVWIAPQIRDFLAFCERDDLYPLFWVAAYTGMRRGEVLGLRHGDANLDEGFLSVRQQVARRRAPQGSVWDTVPPKTPKSRRRVDIDPETVAVLRRHKAAQVEESLRLGDAYDRASDLIFARPDGHFHDPDVVTAAFEKLVRRSGLPRIRLHDLRHSHATILLMTGEPVHLVANRLGHASPMVTLQVYAHVTPGGQAAAAAAFANAIASGR
jgi:integrase